MPPASKQMRQALERLVIAPLRARGFEGEYPHFQRVTSEKRVELLAVEIGAGRYGNCFSVGGAVIFPKESTLRRKNYIPDLDRLPLNTITVYHTVLRKSLPGMSYGGFYYTDVYEERMEPTAEIPQVWYSYEAVSQRRAATFQPREGQRLVQKYDEYTCVMLAEEANRQMPQLLAWMAGLQKPRDLLREHRRYKLSKHKFYRWIEEKFHHE